jgi:hypothetical protein
MSAHRIPTHAYIGVYDGRVLEIVAYHGSCLTAEQVAEIIEAGGWVQRVPIESAARLLGRTLDNPIYNPPPANLAACEAAAREVS